MTAAQPFSSSEMDVIKGKKQGESKSDHLPRGQVTAYYVYHSRRGPAEAGGGGKPNHLTERSASPPRDSGNSWGFVCALLKA